ncbi:response regulator transcription factor [Paraliobacillus sediminis]|uniref:response regulator transcription factor n=1 Tax=Paraliobacillus sediminis TaxID=1885916 RepID=UPI0030845CBD
MMYVKEILIVDDEPGTRDGLKRTLEKWSEGRYVIWSAASANEGMQIIATHQINLLITDIRMPEITGLKLLETINNKPIKPMVIIISAYSEFEYAQEALRLGAVNYMLKPINKAKFIEAVQEALKKEEEQARSCLMEKIIDATLIDVNSEDRYTTTIKQAITFIDKNFERDITLKEIANHVHLNPSYLSTLFKEQTNLSFTEYLTRSRIQHAKKLLITTNKTIADIAETVGYHTPKYFIKLFKDQEKLTPSAYRKK